MDEHDELDALAATAREGGHVLAFQFAPTDDPEEQFYAFPVFLEVGEAGPEEAVTLRIHDPWSGGQLSGLMMQRDEWDRLTHAL